MHRAMFHLDLANTWDMTKFLAVKHFWDFPLLSDWTFMLNPANTTQPCRMQTPEIPGTAAPLRTTPKNLNPALEPPNPPVAFSAYLPEYQFPLN